jgi:hypothetical protein
MELMDNGHPVRDYDPDARPEGFEDAANIVAEDSEESDFSKDQEPVLDDEDLEIEDDEDVDLSGPATEGA